MDKTNKGVLLVIGSTLSISLIYLISDYTLRTFTYITPENAVFWGCLGAIVLSAFYFLSRRKSRNKLKTTIKKDGGILLFVSALTAVGAFLWWTAISMTSSGIVSLLAKTQILIVFLLGIIFLKEKIKLSEFYGIIISIIGFILISTLEGEVSILGIFIIILAESFYALQSFFIKRYAPNIQGPSFAFLRLILITFLLGLFFTVQGKIFIIPIEAWALLSIALIFGSIIAKMLYFEAHKYLPISKLNMYLVLEAVFVLIGATLLFKDPLSLQKIAGAIMIIIGLLSFYKVQEKIKEN